MEDDNERKTASNGRRCKCRITTNGGWCYVDEVEGMRTVGTNNCETKTVEFKDLENDN
jgi:hypothetical protein